MKKIILSIVLTLAISLSAMSEIKRSPNRMGNQLTVTFDCPWNVLCKEAIRYSPSCPDPDVKLDVYYPKNFKSPDYKPVPCLLMIHGGGWSMGNEKKFAMFAAYAASRGYVVACISYRLLPEFELEDCIEDCWLALKWLKQNAASFGGNPGKIGVIGGSAGGHLTAMLATAQESQICKKVFADGTDPSIQAAVPMAPVTDLYSSAKRFSRVFKDAPDAKERAKKASPVSYASAKSAPMHILHSRGDKTVPISESENLQKKYKEFKLECPITYYDSSNHAFWNTHPIGAERMQSWTDAIDIFDKILK